MCSSKNLPSRVSTAGMAVVWPKHPLPPPLLARELPLLLGTIDPSPLFYCFLSLHSFPRYFCFSSEYFVMSPTSTWKVRWFSTSASLYWLHNSCEKGSSNSITSSASLNLGRWTGTNCGNMREFDISHRVGIYRVQDEFVLLWKLCLLNPAKEGCSLPKPKVPWALYNCEVSHSKLLRFWEQ